MTKNVEHSFTVLMMNVKGDVIAEAGIPFDFTVGEIVYDIWGAVAKQIDCVNFVVLVARRFTYLHPETNEPISSTSVAEVWRTAQAPKISNFPLNNIRQPERAHALAVAAELSKEEC